MEDSYKPAVGRIVQFFKQGINQGEAAIITRKHSDTCVNLSVFADGSPTVSCYSSVTNNITDSMFWIAPPRV